MNPTASTQARAAILGRLHDAITTRPTVPAAAPPEVKAWYDQQRLQEDSAQRTARLRAAMQSVKTEVHETTDALWPELLVRIAKAKGIQKLLIGAQTAHGEQLAQSLAPCQDETQALQLLRFDQPLEAWRDQMFNGVDASLTLAKGAIANLGAVILWPNAAEPRSMSLVPPVHFVLLNESTIHTDFLAAMQAEGWVEAMPTNALLISGPSKTSDIQQTLAFGAHGPRELVLLICRTTGGSV